MLLRKVGIICGGDGFSPLWLPQAAEPFVNFRLLLSKELLELIELDGRHVGFDKPISFEEGLEIPVGRRNGKRAFILLFGFLGFLVGTLLDFTLEILDLLLCRRDLHEGIGNLLIQLLLLLFSLFNETLLIGDVRLLADNALLEVGDAF